MITLTPQPQVSFGHAPGKNMSPDRVYAGLVRLHVPNAAVYRDSIDDAFWIDLVANGQLLPTTDFQGSSGCHAPRKIVEFALSPNTDLLLQLSAASKASVRLSVTSTMPPAPKGTPRGAAPRSSLTAALLLAGALARALAQDLFLQTLLAAV